jgi:hypothetical protein
MLNISTISTHVGKSVYLIGQRFHPPRADSQITFQGARLCHALKWYFVFEILTSRALYIAEEALPVKTPTFLLSVVVFF